MGELSRRSSLHRRVITSRLVDDFEENDDEAERLARRERFSTGSDSPSTSSRADQNQLNTSLHLTTNELNNQITECIKLSTENKINDKNAFQLKMIDFLVYALRKHDPNMSNLQVASASLDASAKIYGFRVDKVHMDVLKILGVRHRNNEDGDAEAGGNEVLERENEQMQAALLKKKKKKKTQLQLLLSTDKLRGNTELYDPVTLIRCRDTQTSDMLFQANSTQHANQISVLNHFRDVVLDSVPNVRNEFKFIVPAIDDLQYQEISPSYAAFKFNHWTETAADEEENHDYHFDLDADVSVPDNNEGISDGNEFMDCDDVFEERCNRLEQSSNNVNIVDFQDIISNNANPNQSYEYSYIQKNYSIKWAGPSHWRIKINRNLGATNVVESCKQTNKRGKKVLDLNLDEDSKKLAENKFNQKKTKLQLNNKGWSEEKHIMPEEVDKNYKRFCAFFIRPNCLKMLEVQSDLRHENIQNHNDFDDDHNSSDSIDFGIGNGDLETPNNDLGINDNNGEDFNNGSFPGENPVSTQATLQPFTQTQEAFTGDNLVSAPRLAEKVFIPYSQRAKKIDMRQLKKVVWKNLKKSSGEEDQENDDNCNQSAENDRIKPKMFSNVFLEIPQELPKTYAESLSPGIAFVSILHLAHEKNLKINQVPDLSDLKINDGASFSD